MNQAPKNNLWREKDKIGHAPRAAASRQADAIKPAGDAARNWIREQTVAGQVGFVRANDRPLRGGERQIRSEEHTSELQSLRHLVCRLLLENNQKRVTALGALSWWLWSLAFLAAPLLR